MKSIFVAIVALAVLLSPSDVNAKADDKARIKCHIALLGGTEIIHYKIMPANQGASYFDKLKKNKRINKKRTTERIFDVFECVPFGQKFTESKANALENSLPK
ncbi:TapY2 family type IVa secretion system protein [Thalassotalea montiporae]